MIDVRFSDEIVKHCPDISVGVVSASVVNRPTSDQLWDEICAEATRIAETYELLAINPDVCGWINVYGTKIDYPVVQGPDNRKYLSTSATLEFSDGSKEKIELKQTAEPQTFTFAKRRVNSVKLTNLVSDEPTKWSGITEIEFWGVSAE